MCYSAMVKQNIRKLALKYQARVDTDLYEEMFDRRLIDESILITRGLEAEFLNPTTDQEERIFQSIQKYRLKQRTKFAAELQKQTERLKKAVLALEKKATKKALDDQRIATTKIKWLTSKLERLESTEVRESDNRIFPMNFAPIIVIENGEQVIKLARYHCRPNGLPPSIDKKYDGLYNARRDNLDNPFWKNLIGKKHAFFVVESFFENVAKHDYEKRPLNPDEKEENLVLHFTPNQTDVMEVACLYDLWESKEDHSSFFSFTAITNEPTPEIAETGHERLIVALQEEQRERWLNPENLSRQEIEFILDSPKLLYYRHLIAA